MADDPWGVSGTEPASTNTSPVDPWGVASDKPPIGVGEDVVKSIPYGAVRSIASQASGLGMADLGAAGYTLEQMPTSADVQKTIETHLTGPLHQPETKYGEIAASSAGFAADPMAYVGPGGIPYKLLRAGMAGAGSEFARQQAEGTMFETPAAVMGALAADPGAWANVIRRSPHGIAPTAEELLDAGDAGYNAVRGSGVQVERAHVAQAGQRMLDDLEADGLDAAGAPRTWNALRRLSNPPGAPRPTNFMNPSQMSAATPVDLDYIERTRRLLRGAAKDLQNGEERNAARRSIAAIDDFVGTLDPGHVTPQSRPVLGLVQDLIHDSRANWAAGRRAQTVADDIDSIEARAARQAGSSGYGANINNAIRQQAKRILNSPNLRRGFNEEELDQLNRINAGTFTGNAARLLEKMVRPNQITTMGHLALGLKNPLLLIPGVAGLAAKGVADASTQRQLRLLDQMVRRRSPLYQPPPPAAGRPWLYGDIVSPLYGPYGGAGSPFSP